MGRRGRGGWASPRKADHPIREGLVPWTQCLCAPRIRDRSRIPSVMALGGEALGKGLGREWGALVMGLLPLPEGDRPAPRPWPCTRLLNCEK